MSRPPRPRCPCCGTPNLTEGELRVLVALCTAPDWATVTELSEVTSLSDRSVTRAISRLGGGVCMSRLRELSTGQFEYTITANTREIVMGMAASELRIGDAAE